MFDINLDAGRTFKDAEGKTWLVLVHVREAYFLATPADAALPTPVSLVHDPERQALLDKWKASAAEKKEAKGA